MKTKKWSFVAPIVGIAALIGSVGIGTTVFAASAGAAATPAAASHGGPEGGVSNYKNTLSKNTKGWCTYAGGCNGQIGASDYGTIDVVPASFSNDGGYAAGVPGPGKGHGQKAYGRVSGAGVDQDTSAGCASPGSENCTGPYILYGGSGTDSIFPTKTGFTSSVDLYLDTSWAAANPNQVVDWDVSLNDNTGAFLRDFVFNLCSTANNGGGFYVSISNGAGGCSTGPTEITTSGWYTFSQQFVSVGGQVVCYYSLTNSTNQSELFTLQQTGIATADAGGPNYGWFPDEDVLGLPVALVSLTK